MNDVLKQVKPIPNSGGDGIHDSVLDGLRARGIDPFDTTQISLRELAALYARAARERGAKEFTLALPTCGLCGMEARCGGVGHVRREVPYGHPDFGKAFPCPNRPVTANSAQAAMRNTLPARFQEFSLENWIGTDDAARQAAQEAIERGAGIVVFYARDEHDRPVFGNGKTGLLAAIFNNALTRGKSAEYHIVAEMLKSLQELIANKDQSYMMYDRWQDLKDLAVLCLDEFHRFKITEWSIRMMEELIDYRYARADRLLTVVATNEVPDKGDPNPISSRFADARFSRIVRVGGGDMRPYLGRILGAQSPATAGTSSSEPKFHAPQPKRGSAWVQDGAILQSFWKWQRTHTNFDERRTLELLGVKNLVDFQGTQAEAIAILRKAVGDDAGMGFLAGAIPPPPH